ncbi:TPA: VOC family protein [Pseudomonas aeruginosa]|uniref:VOC family protein n=1 Tax=Pseudomonas aeruginosa TaxID=287 RepID=UPI00046379D5|nr:VOC family protein [Pseudomonas aeruginosa]EIU1681289.1 VOC family protein [Pseudomonas aeruginosa]EKV4568787.1 VOC family protein [Pseudomonas aeruginosa]KSD38643.1 drug:proton antiporter [Pseudomonas aeruginosa]MBH8875141.1 VOC family protein [Pseudomonas aeruginosa]MBI8971330.1 VOC family protein [Pseudomonas aeruginosa]
MIAPSLLNLYVDDPARSAAFYRRLLARESVEQSADFALFVFDNGFKLGLWARAGVAPASSVPGGGDELCFQVDSDDEVRRLHRLWREGGVEIVQAPQSMDFGYTFCGLDPDGHRLRVYRLAL